VSRPRCSRASRRAGTTRVQQPLNAPAKVKDTDYSLDIQYRIGDLTLGSTTAYQKETQDNTQDLFLTAKYFWNELTGAGNPGAPPPFYNFQTVTIDSRQLSEEIKLASPTDQTFSYLVGLFYSDTEIKGGYYRTFVPARQFTDHLRDQDHGSVRARYAELRR
jgi:iron complex outermembrane receptor protein